MNVGLPLKRLKRRLLLSHGDHLKFMELSPYIKDT